MELKYLHITENVRRTASE